MSSDRTLLSRYECKYFVAPDLVPKIRMMARPFMRPDPFSRRSPGLRYRVSSLYLDTPDLALYSTTVRGLRNRFKLRIRSYSDDQASPIFCEVKRRADRVVRKIRVQTPRSYAAALVANGFRDDSVAMPDGGLGDFIKRCRDVDARPFVHIRYMREAYESNGPDPVRITFDTDLSFLGFDPSAPFRVGGEGWVSTPMEGTIVEIKFTDHCPSWVTSLVDRLQLVRESIPKYVLSVDHARSLNWVDASEPRIRTDDGRVLAADEQHG